MGEDHNSIKTKLLSLLLFIFLIAACNLKTTAATPIVVTNIYDTPNVVATLQVDPALSNDAALTKQAFIKLCLSFGFQGLATFYPNVYYSPSRELSFTLCENFLDDKTTYPFIISRVSTGQSRGFEPEIVAPDWIANFPSTTFKPDLWNKNTLIFRAYIIPCLDNFLCLYRDGEALYEANLESGEFSTLLAPQTTSPSFSYAFSISPDGKYLGYVNHSSPEMVYIRDLASGKENKITLPEKYLRVGAFVWTPDSKEFLFFGISYDDNLFNSSLFLFDRINSSLSVLLDHRSGTYFPGQLTSDKVENWYQQDILYLGSIDSPHLYINIRTKEINQVPTSIP